MHRDYVHFHGCILIYGGCHYVGGDYGGAVYKFYLSTLVFEVGYAYGYFYHLLGLYGK